MGSPGAPFYLSQSGPDPTWKGCWEGRRAVTAQSFSGAVMGAGSALLQPFQLSVHRGRACAQERSSLQPLAASTYAVPACALLGGATGSAPAHPNSLAFSF